MKNLSQLRIRISRRATFKYKFKRGEIKIFYRLHLDADLFNEILDNYNNSLPRKRVRFMGSELSKLNASGARKFNFTKSELKILIWIMPRYKIAELHEKRFSIRISTETVTY